MIVHTCFRGAQPFEVRTPLRTVHSYPPREAAYPALETTTTETLDTIGSSYRAKGTIYVFLKPVNEVWGKVMFLHLSVTHSVRRGYLPHYILGYTTPRETAPSRQTPPPDRQPPPRILRDTLNKRAVRILLECILVLFTSTIITT